MEEMMEGIAATGVKAGKLITYFLLFYLFFKFLFMYLLFLLFIIIFDVFVYSFIL